jgi:predicted Zn-dependent peptidase
VTLEAGNNLRELEIEENYEIKRILSSLSGRVGNHATEISQSITLVAELDLALAKAKLRGTLILSLDSNGDRMGRLGSAAVIEREILSPEELVVRLDALTLDDVSLAIERSVRLEESNVVLVGPQGDDIAENVALS